MIAHVDWLFTEASPKLRYVCDGHVVERPKGIFIERRMSLFQTYFNAIGQEVVLPEKIPFLDKIIQRTIITF